MIHKLQFTDKTLSIFTWACESMGIIISYKSEDMVNKTDLFMCCKEFKSCGFTLDFHYLLGH